MPKAKTGVAVPKMGAGILSSASPKGVTPTPGAAAMPIMKPKASKKPKAASTQPVAAPTATRGGGGGVMKPKKKKSLGVTQAPGASVTNTPQGLI